MTTWTILLTVSVIFLIAIRIFLRVHNQIEVLSAGLVAIACLMIALGISPLLLQLTLVLTLLLIEWWLLYHKPASEQ
ncbi:MAG: hypothetical protein AAFV72_12860 [Cyanobacteria bacterium J06635_1]